MYIRACVDDDIDAARQALGEQVLSYAMAQPGTPPTLGYRGLFAEMGFGEVLSELEERKDSGEPVGALVSAVPDEFLNSVGYFGPAAGRSRSFLSPVARSRRNDRTRRNCPPRPRAGGCNLGGTHSGARPKGSWSAA